MCGPRITTIEPRSCQQRATMNKHMPQTPPQTLSIRCQFAVNSLSIRCPLLVHSLHFLSIRTKLEGQNVGFAVHSPHASNPIIILEGGKGSVPPGWLWLRTSFARRPWLTPPSRILEFYRRPVLTTLGFCPTVSTVPDGLLRTTVF